MKNFKFLLLFAGIAGAILFAATQSVAYDDNEEHRTGHVVIHDDEDFDFTSFDFEGRDLVVIHREDRKAPEEEVRFTENGKLFINDEEIKLDDNQRALVIDFYADSREIYDQAIDIGKEGAKIGIKGAALGIDAIGSLAKLLSSDYDIEDYEKEMEAKAKRLEKQADKLEARAEKIEQMAENLEEAADRMQDAIPKIDDLKWF
jgi:hypothetical protein